MKTYELDERIKDALKAKGWLRFTEPQKEAIPKILQGRNVLLIAPTGIGKTEAAVLPLFHMLLENPGPGISILYITPLRALNRDMYERMQYFSRELGISVGVRHGDTSQRERQRQSRDPPQMLITTPETLQIMFSGKRLREGLKNLRWVVVDEVHELVGEERGAQLTIGLERLEELVGSRIQRVGLSATVGDPSLAASFLVGQGRKAEIVEVDLRRPIRITVESPPPIKNNALLKATRSEPKQAAAIERAREIVEGHTSTLFFVNTRDTAEILATKYRLWDEDFKIGIHHGSLSKSVRVQMEDAFKSGELRSLICTSSLELGIDVGSADHSIQFNSPRRVARLVQRVGRAGHSAEKTPEGTVIAIDPDDVAEAAVTARRALAGEMEPTAVRENPLAVLANQILSWLAADYELDLGKAYEIIKRAFPFRNLRWQDFMAVVDQLSQIGLVWIDGEKVNRRRPALEYFYSNLSMIPDERTYLVRDITSRQIIGTLDESFVVTTAKPQVVFIMRGRPWLVVDVGEEEVTVEPVSGAGDPPSWLGEDIPVDADVSMEVGRLRRTLDWGGYPVTENAKEELGSMISKQTKKGFDPPSDRLITVEVGDRVVVINSPFGSKGNETLGRLVSSLLMARMGESIGLRTDPYRIILDLPRNLNGEAIREFLFQLDPGALEPLLDIIVKRSTHLRWQFFHVARKFGIITKNADYRSMNIERLMDVYRDSVVFRETMGKVIWEKMDIGAVAEGLKAIQNGSIDVVVTGLSPIGLAGYESKREYLVPQHPDHSILMALKRRLMDENVLLLCTSCGWSTIRGVRRVEDKVRCGSCDSVLVASLNPRDVDKVRIVKKKQRTKAEERELKRLRKNANLVMENGQKAVIAMRARGVGPDVAARVLSNLHLEEDDFYRDLLLAEVNYAKTKRFWD